MTEEPRKSWVKKLGGHLRTTIIEGIMILIPFALTYIIVKWMFDRVDGLLRNLIEWGVQEFGLDVPSLPGLGLIALLLVAYLLGLVWRKRVGRRVIRTLRHYILMVPVVGAIFGPARQLIDSFRGDGAAGFKRVVLVEYPKQGTWMVGFLTGITSIEPGSVMGVVYLPTAPTPNSGWVAVIPVQEIYDTTLTVQQAMSMVLSGGISSPVNIELKAMDPLEAASYVEQGGMAGTPENSPQSGIFNLPFGRRGENNNTEK